VSESVKESILLRGFPTNVQQRYTDEIYQLLNSKIKDNYTARGYKLETEVTQPFKKNKDVPPHYRALQGYKLTFTKGSEFGTSVELTWKEKELDILKINIEEEPPRKTNIVALTCILMCVLLYGLTIYFWEFWVVTIASGLVCCLLPILFAIAPAVGGLAVGVFLGRAIYRASVSAEVSDHNYKERVFMHKEVMTFANQQVVIYRQRINEQAQQAPFNQY